MNVAATCRHYGITRQTFYTWEKRYKSEGEAGLQERSKAPKFSPRATNSSGAGKDHLPTPELPLWAPEDCDVLGALSRCHH
jgi:transposase-like protein